MTIATRVIYKNRNFAIIEDKVNGGYWGIEDKFIKNGRITKEFNGINGHFFKDMNNTITEVQNTIDINEWDANNPDATEQERIQAIVKIVTNRQ